MSERHPTRNFRGASTTEYIVIIASVVLGTAMAFGRFGDVVRDQGANISAELAGIESDASAPDGRRPSRGGSDGSEGGGGSGESPSDNPGGAPDGGGFAGGGSASDPGTDLEPFNPDTGLDPFSPGIGGPPQRCGADSDNKAPGFELVGSSLPLFSADSKRRKGAGGQELVTRLDGRTPESCQASERQSLQQKLNRLVKNGTLDTTKGFDNPDDAAVEVLMVVAPLSRDSGFEIGGNIVKREDGLFRFTAPRVGSPNSFFAKTDSPAFHTHPGGGLIFSNPRAAINPNAVDTVWVNTHEQNLYLGVERFNGKVGVSVCEVGNCPNRGSRSTEGFGTKGRVIQ